MFAPVFLVLLLLLAFGQMAFAEPTVGAALFGWPPQRPFNYYTERLAPCGGPGVGGRVEIPTKHARLAFLAQRDVGVSLAISYSEDPTSEDDFETLKYLLPFGHLNLVPGITCLILGDPVPGAAHGRNATLQFRYMSNYESPKDDYEYRYSCADVTFSDTVDSYNGDICRNKTRPFAYDRLSGPFLDPEDEHDETPPPPDRGNYVEVEVDGPPFPSWGVALIAVGASFLISIICILVYKFILEPRNRRKTETPTMWVPPPC